MLLVNNIYIGNIILQLSVVYESTASHQYMENNAKDEAGA